MAKTCSKCGVEKGVGEFYRSKRDGFLSECKQCRAKRAQETYTSDPKYKLKKQFSWQIRNALDGRKAGRHWEELVGYTLDDLKQHLERQFEPYMTWENYGDWHIDHRIPVAVFNFDHPENIDFKRCWALENLQPMWAQENQSKGAKIDKPFQPMLRLRIS